MAGWERGEELGQCRRVWSSLPTIWMRRQEGQSLIAFVISGVCVVIGKVEVRWDVVCGLGSEAQ